MTPLILLFSIATALATSEAQNLFEKTFPRDNTFCRNKTGRIEIAIRGESKYTEPSERGFGEFLFTRTDKKKVTVLDLNSSRSDSYKLFYGVSPMCSKTLGYMVDPKTLAVLLLKENKPFKEKLVIQFFDFETLTPKEYLETDYMTDKAKKYEDGFVFNSHPERLESDLGKITIDGVQYVYQDRDFPTWVRYSKKGFEALPSLTFENFQWKKYFKNEADFLGFTGWDAAKKIFTKKLLYIAVNHNEKKNCFLFTDQKKKFDGSEGWRCQTM